MFEGILKYGSKMIFILSFLDSLFFVIINIYAWKKFCHPKFSLREAFGIPLFLLQIYFILEKLKNEEKSSFPVLVTTVMMGLSWQFSQFIVLLESITVIVLNQFKLWRIFRN